MGLRWCSVWDDKLLGDRYWWVSVELVYRSVCSMSSSIRSFSSFAIKQVGVRWHHSGSHGFNGA